MYIPVPSRKPQQEAEADYKSLYPDFAAPFAGLVEEEGGLMDPDDPMAVDQPAGRASELSCLPDLVLSWLIVIGLYGCCTASCS